MRKREEERKRGRKCERESIKNIIRILQCEGTTRKRGFAPRYYYRMVIKK